MDITDDDTDLLTTEEAAKIIRIRAITLQIWRQRGFGPEYIRLNGRVVRYSRRQIKEFLATQVCTPAGRTLHGTRGPGRPTKRTEKSE